MQAQTQVAGQTQTASVDPVPDWGRTKLVAFRFCCVYFSLYVLVTQMLTSLIFFPWIDWSDLGSLPPIRTMISWAARHVFHHQSALVVTGSGSGDKTFDWVEAFCLLVIAAIATAIWSVVDRKCRSYVTAHKWFRVFVRFALGSTLLTYGFDKAIPLQMQYPYLSRLIEPFGNFSPMGVLWASIGSSPGYEIFAGCAEILGGLLVLIPRTAMLGALVCLADVIQVFVLNMTYDVPVKLFSFHLVLLTLFLLAPEATRLANFFFRDQPGGPSTQPALFRTRRASRNAVLAQIALISYLVAMNIYGSTQAWKQYGGGAPKSILYGIWDVDEFTMDGQARAPLLTDGSRWRRIVFQSPDSVTFQRMDDTLIGYGAFVYKKDQSFALALRDTKELKADFAFQLPTQGRLVLDGAMDGHKIHMQLQLVDHDKFLLVSRGFHWIQEYPFNR
jgi:uncharacterized membrane protein YphA (DoxX/SURF4 family)